MGKQKRPKQRATNVPHYNDRDYPDAPIVEPDPIVVLLLSHAWDAGGAGACVTCGRQVEKLTTVQGFGRPAPEQQQRLEYVAPGTRATDAAVDKVMETLMREQLAGSWPNGGSSKACRSCALQGVASMLGPEHIPFLRHMADGGGFISYVLQHTQRGRGGKQTLMVVMGEGTVQPDMALREAIRNCQRGHAGTFKL